MAVHTCPRCELRFELHAELVDHLETDHAVAPDSLKVVPEGERPRRDTET